MTSPTLDPLDPESAAGPLDPESAAGPLDPESAAGPLDPEAAVAPTAKGTLLAPYDAVLLLSFGGPEAPDEIMPFLRTVTGGRGIPDSRLEAVAEHYYRFGGKSPINDQNRTLIAALRTELDRREIFTPLLWGNRNAAPFLIDVLRSAHERGLRRIVTIVTSAYSSYSSCRQYRENLADAVGALREEGRSLDVDKIRPYYNHPGFARANSRLVSDAVRPLGGREDARVRLVFVTHSIPVAMDDTSGPGDGEGNAYQRQHQSLATAITEEVRATFGRDLKAALVYCSRSGAPGQPWLEPDVNDHLRELAREGVSDVVIVPIGFVSDHMEVKFDLDTEAAETAKELGLHMIRVPTVGTDAEFVSGLVDLVEERAAQARGEGIVAPAWPEDVALPSVCPSGCCPNLREGRPAACGAGR